VGGEAGLAFLSITPSRFFPQRVGVPPDSVADFTSSISKRFQGNEHRIMGKRPFDLAMSLRVDQFNDDPIFISWSKARKRSSFRPSPDKGRTGGVCSGEIGV
jgi:hypothetical protein